MTERAALLHSREKTKARKTKVERYVNHTAETVSEKEARGFEAKAGIVVVAGEEADPEMYERF